MEDLEDIEPEDFGDGERFLTEFSAKDAILEPKMLTLYQKFLELGGDQEAAVEQLAGGYEGLPRMVNALSQWLQIAGCKQREVHVMIEEHVTSMVLKHFDPKKADHVLVEGGETPSWLEEMIHFPVWRQLLYQLSELHSECILLKFALKLIRDAGYQGEFVTVSSTASQYDVFAAALVKSFTELVKCKPESFDDHLRDFSELASHSQHTYLYTQTVLQALTSQSTDDDDVASSDKGNPHLAQWLSQHLFRQNLSRSRDVVKTFLHIKAVGTYSRLFDALSSMISRNALNPADISILYEHYTSVDDPAPVEFLHIPQLLELLIQSLFKPGQPINSEYRHKYLYILAYASSVPESQVASSPRATRSELESTREALETAHQLVTKATTSQAELQAELMTLLQALQCPVVAMGVLRWLEHLITEPSFFKVASNSYTVYLILLDEIATHHQLQHSSVLNFLTQLFETSYPELGAEEQLELKRITVDRLVHLFSCGHAVAVTTYMCQCVDHDDTDTSVIRHFVQEVLAIIAPPFSNEFASSLLPLLRNDDITQPLRTSDNDDVIDMFIAECTKKSSTKKKKK